MKRQALVFNLANLLILLPLFALSLSVGVAEFHWSRIFSSTDSMQLMLISRLPRTFAVVLSGASLAVAGMIMQILMKNRFVEPSMVGASQSAALALLLMMLFAPSVAPLLRMSVGAAAAMAGMLLFMALISRLPPTAQLMVPLVGIIFGGVIESAAVFIGYETDMLQMLGIWQQGDFSGVLLGRYELLWFTGILALAAYLIADRLTIAGLGETVSVNLGLNRNTILWSGLVIVALIPRWWWLPSAIFRLSGWSCPTSSAASWATGCAAACRRSPCSARRRFCCATSSAASSCFRLKSPYPSCSA